MKILLMFFFLLNFVDVNSQDFVISRYEKADIKNRGPFFAEKLSANREKALILKLEDYKFIVFDENDKIYGFELSSEYDIENKFEIPKESISNCMLHLDSLKTINPSALNYTEKKDSVGRVVEGVKVEDGLTYKLELFKQGITIEYISYSPEIYIEQQFPFYRERLKLLGAYNCYRAFFNKREEREFVSEDNKFYRYFEKLTCTKLNYGIIDAELYRIADGRIIFKEEYDKSKMFKVTLNDGKFFYVSKRLKKDILKVLKKEKCVGIKIEKIPVVKHKGR